MARAYYERVPQRVYATLAGLFVELAAEGSLRVENADMAAQHFAWLVLGTHLDRGMFMGNPADATMSADDSADDAVRCFWQRTRHRLADRLIRMTSGPSDRG